MPLVAGLTGTSGAPRVLEGHTRLRVHTPPHWVALGTLNDLVYYMNDNFSPDGNPIVGQIAFGAVERDALTGKGRRAYTNLTDGSRSVVYLGDYVFVTGGDRQGIRRLDAEWKNPSGYVNPNGTNPESVATDGNWLFANNDVSLSVIHAYTVKHHAERFELQEQWQCDLGGGRVRGISYDDSGHLYLSNGATTAGDERRIFAVRASDGTATDLGVDVPGEADVFGVTRHHMDGRDYLLVVDALNLHVWPMADDVTLADEVPDTHPVKDLGVLPALRGVSANSNRLYLAFARCMAAFELSTSPAGE